MIPGSKKTGKERAVSGKKSVDWRASMKKRKEEQAVIHVPAPPEVPDTWSCLGEHLSWNLILMFCLLIFGLTAANILRPQTGKSETENRTLMQRPALTWSSLISGEFAGDYEEYLSDQFVLRDRWIALKTGFERLTGRTEIHDVYFADDDYLIESHDGVFTDAQATGNITTLSAFFEKLTGEMGYSAEHLTAMVVPNAVDILRDKLPAFADPYDEEDYLAQIADALPEGVYYDAALVLRAHTDDQLYYRTDHHWTTQAAFCVFSDWIGAKGYGTVDPDLYTTKTVTRSFQGTVASQLGISGRADTIERIDFLRDDPYVLTYNRSDDVRHTVYQEQCLDTKDKYAYFYGGNYGLIQEKSSAVHSYRSLLVIKDSYAHCFVPFTYDYFDRVDMVDPRYYNASLAELIEENGYTDVLFLFNASGFAEETSIARLLS